ncbi:MAG: LLM class flavin-dependent oxidoreductase [Acidimicrobiales bacterium]
MPAIPLSVLDLAVVPEGSTSTEALRATTTLAARADQLGYLRFWVAEHHNMATVASTEPAVLIAHLAANTERIRLGSGGVMLPNHAPLVVAEQFAMLEALHPDRIDLGIGRAPGTDRNTMRALRRNLDVDDVDRFPQDVLDVMALLGDVRTETGPHTHLRATPVATTSPAIALLGSSGYSAQLAGMLGLPFGFAHHFDMGGTIEAAEIYRNHFTPSPVLSEPHLIVTAAVIAAESAERADHLLAPHRLRKYGMRTGRMLPLLSPEDACAHPEYDAALAAGSNAIHGEPAHVAAGIAELARRTEASEIMVAIPATDPADRVTSLDLLAAAWRFRPAEPAPS